MNYLDLSLWLVIPFLCLALVLCLCRVFLGPTSADRVVALDLLVNFGVAVIASAAIAYREAQFLDIAIVLALVGYLGTVTFAYYIEKRTEK